jgi:hypothetical protein
MQDERSEALGELPVQGDVEPVPASREVLLEFASDCVQPTRCIEDARADLLGNATRTSPRSVAASSN